MGKDTIDKKWLKTLNGLRCLPSSWTQVPGTADSNEWHSPLIKATTPLCGLTNELP